MHVAAAGDSFDNDGRTLLLVDNASGVSVNLTLDDPNTPVPEGSTGVNNDAVVTIAAGAKRFIGPLKPSRFNDANGRCQLAWSATASVTWAAVSAA